MVQDNLCDDVNFVMKVVNHKDRKVTLSIKFNENYLIFFAISCLLSIRDLVPDTISLWMFF